MIIALRDQDRLKATSPSTTLNISTVTQPPRKETTEMIFDQYSGGIRTADQHLPGERQPSKSRMHLATGREGVLQGLSNLGFTIPQEVIKIAACSTAKLSASGYSVDLYTLDEALAKYDIKTLARIAFKVELEREGLLER